MFYKLQGFSGTWFNNWNKYKYKSKTSIEVTECNIEILDTVIEEHYHNMMDSWVNFNDENLYNQWLRKFENT